jgi:hypothetical protein
VGNPTTDIGAPSASNNGAWLATIELAPYPALAGALPVI